MVYKKFNWMSNPAQKKNRFLRLKKYWFELIVILVASIIVISTSKILSPTWDEAKHTFNGVFYLREKECCISEETPFSGFHAIFLEKYIPKSLNRTDQWETIYSTEYRWRLLFLSRIFNVVFYALLLIIVWLWSKEILSQKIARYCLVLAAFSPTIMAHAGIATEDMFITTWAFISFYLFWRFTKKQTYKNIILASIAVGISLLTRISAIFLYLCIVLSFSIFFCGRGFKHKKLLKYTTFLIILIVIPLFILNLGYFFKGTFSSLDDLQFESSKLNELKDSHIGKIPLPLPGGYLKAIDFNRVRARLNARAYFFGEFYTHNLPHYFITAFFIKTSVILLFFIFLGIYKFKNNNKDLWLMLCLFLFPIVFLLVNSFLNTFNTSIRYILPVYPFLIVVSGYSFLTKKQIILKGLLALFVIVSIINFPNYLSFFNISSFFIPKEVMLADSNLDWGQMNHLIKRDMDEKNITDPCFIIRAYRTINYIYGFSGQYSYNPYPRKCILYISKASARGGGRDIRFYPYLNEKDYELGGIIEVYNISSEDKFKNKFLNHWNISTPFPKPNSPISKDYLEGKEKSLNYTSIITEFGYVDVSKVYSGKLTNMCVIAKSDEKVRGQLLVSADDTIIIYDENGIYLNKKTPSPLRFSEINKTIKNARNINALACNNQGFFGFGISYDP